MLVLCRVRTECLSLLLVAPLCPYAPVANGDSSQLHQLLSGEPWRLPQSRDLLSQARGKYPTPVRNCGWMNLNATGLPENVIKVQGVIQGVRAQSISALYNRKMAVFEHWCDQRGELDFQCSYKACWRRVRPFPPSNCIWQLYQPAMWAGTISLGNTPLGVPVHEGHEMPLPSAVAFIIPVGNIPGAGSHVRGAPFKPLQEVDIKMLSIKTALLLLPSG